MRCAYAKEHGTATCDGCDESIDCEVDTELLRLREERDDLEAVLDSEKKQHEETRGYRQKAEQALSEAREKIGEQADRITDLNFAMADPKVGGGLLASVNRAWEERDKALRDCCSLSAGEELERSVRKQAEQDRDALRERIRAYCDVCYREDACDECSLFSNPTTRPAPDSEED